MKLLVSKMVACNVVLCSKQADYGYIYREGLKCNIHRKSDMDNVTRKRCEVCVKTIVFYGTEKATHCAKCKSDDMFNIKGTLCIVCNKVIPTYAVKSDSKKPTHCATCRTSEMVDVKNSTCRKCKKTKPTYGVEIGKPTHCKKCKTDIMFDVLHDNALCEICQKVRASYGLIKNKPTRCTSCKTEEMSNVVSTMCITCGIKQANYGYSKDNITHCKGCSDEKMINVCSKLCIVCNLKQPSFGLIEKYPTHCFDCKSLEMKDVVSKKCKADLCETHVYNPAYEGYCAYCFGNLFPNNPIVKNCKTKERKVADFIMEKYPNNNWKFDKIVAGGCSRRRPDIFINLESKVIIVEIDENQHNKYEDSCENKRLMLLYMDINPEIFKNYNPPKALLARSHSEHIDCPFCFVETCPWHLRNPDLNNIEEYMNNENIIHKPIIFIRFNPDKYKDKNNKNVPSCFSVSRETGLVKINNTKNWNDRLNDLKDKIDYWIENTTKKTIENAYLYFDGY